MFLKEGFRDFLRDYISDLCRVKLLALKGTYFFLLFGAVIVWPHFTIHQKELGLTKYQTGIYGSVMAVIGIFLPFVSGVAGDKMGNYKVLMCLTTALAGVPAMLLSWVPSAKVDLEIITEDIRVNATDITYAITSEDNRSVLSVPHPEATQPGVDPEKLVQTFWIYMSVRVLYGALQSTGYTLFESAVMANMQNSDINFGYQRVWGTIAVIVSSLIGGPIIEVTGSYSVVFYVSAASQFVTAMLMLGVNMDFKPPSTSLAKCILKYFLKAEVLMFFGIMLVTGMLFGYLETFMYRFLADLGATPILLNLTVTVGAPFEIIFTLIASHFVKIMGHAPVMMLGMIAYAIRLLGMSFLTNPWLVLLLEILESMANGILLTTAIMYCTVLFSMDTIASFRGIFAVMYFGVGKLLGTVIGSEIREVVGDRTTFQVLAVVAAVTTAAYCAGILLLKRHRLKGSAKDTIDVQREDTKKMDNELGMANKVCQDRELT